MSGNIFHRYEEWRERVIGDLLHGKDEDIFVRGARRKQIRERYGDPHLAAWCPGVVAYAYTRDALRNPECSKKEKAALIAAGIALEIALDVTRAGIVYGFYKIMQYTS